MIFTIMHQTYYNYNNTSSNIFYNMPVSIKNQRYRSGSTSDSAINVDSSIEDESRYQNMDRYEFNDDLNQLFYYFVILALEDENYRKSGNFKKIKPIIRNYYQPQYTKQDDHIVDSFGFIRTENVCDEIGYLQDACSILLNNRAKSHWINGQDNIKCFIREYGIPNELRPKIWLTFIKTKIGNQYNIDDLLMKAKECNIDLAEETIRQIDLDIDRTIPSHTMFHRTSGRNKLRQILIAYSVFVNPSIGYCQSMNFICAILLIIFQENEKHALMGLICIIEHYFPPHYFDENLTGARADQMVLQDILTEYLFPENKESENESLLFQIVHSLSLNWFISLFHNSLPWQTHLYILDCFWLEGVKILFRFSVALMELSRQSINISSSATIGDMVNIIRDRAKICYDVAALKKIAFNVIKIPKRRQLATKRAFFVKQIMHGNNSEPQSLFSIFNKRSLHQSLSSLSTLSQLFSSTSLLSSSISSSSLITISSSDGSILATFDNKEWRKGVIEIKIFNTLTSILSKRTLSINKSSTLFGINKDGSQLIFYQKAKSVNKLPDWALIIPAQNDVAFAYYDEYIDIALLINSNGSLTKYNCKTHLSETITLSCKINYTSYDPYSRFLWIHSGDNKNMNNDNSYFLLTLVDIMTMDIFNVTTFYNISSLTSTSSKLLSLGFMSSFNDNCCTISYFDPFSSFSFSSSTALVTSDENSVVNMKAFPLGSFIGLVVIFRSGRLMFIQLHSYTIIKKKCCLIGNEFIKHGTILSCTLTDNVTIVLFAPVNKIARIIF